MPIEPTLFRLRVRYVKRGRLRYLGHLEVARTVERSVRRAGLPYAVTQGFSPHMRVAFTAALPVGTSSTCEWYDLVLTEYVPADEALAGLVAATPADLAPQQAGYVDMRAETLGLLVTRQDYRIDLSLTGVRSAAELLPASRAALDGLIAEGTIRYLRGRKEKTLDLAALLTEAKLEARADDAGFVLELKTRSSNAGSLRPEILLSAWDARFGAGDSDEPIVSTGIPHLANFERAEVERIDQYGEDESGNRVDPL